jgi:uncharacterized membrane protein YfcA
MDDVIPALGMIFAAFAVWLGVRIFNRRERWAIRTAVAIALIVVLCVGTYVADYIVSGVWKVH